MRFGSVRSAECGQTDLGAGKNAFGSVSPERLATLGTHDHDDRRSADRNERTGTYRRANTRRQRRPDRELSEQISGASQIRTGRRNRWHRASACTLLLGVIPHNRICVTPRAVFAFHVAWDLGWTGAQANAPATKYLWLRYPDGVRRWIAQHGGLRSKTIYLSGRESGAMFPTCR
jgi:hypothetical protein